MRNEPVNAEPIDTEPAGVAAVAAEPVSTVVVQPEVVDAEPVDAEPVDAEPVDTEPAGAGAVAAEPVSTEVFDAEPVNVEVVRPEALDAEAVDPDQVDGPGPAGRWRAPVLWRFVVWFARALVFPVSRLQVSGDLPARLRDGPVIVAVNHIGPFDPAVVCAAFGTRHVAPRLMATGGLFRAPLLGSFMRACGHIRVNRRSADVAGAVDDVLVALRQGSVIVGYPEGRITLDPGMWPERGRTGLARVALRTGVPVVPVAQWGAHEVLAWGGLRPSLARLATAVFRRPVVRVRFGPPVDLTGIVDGTPGAAQQATDRIMDAIVTELTVLRVDEPRLPRYIDPVRPLSTARSHRRPPTRDH